MCTMTEDKEATVLEGHALCTERRLVSGLPTDRDVFVGREPERFGRYCCRHWSSAGGFGDFCSWRRGSGPSDLHRLANLDCGPNGSSSQAGKREHCGMETHRSTIVRPCECVEQHTNITARARSHEGRWLAPNWTQQTARNHTSTGHSGRVETPTAKVHNIRRRKHHRPHPEDRGCPTA